MRLRLENELHVHGTDIRTCTYILQPSLRGVRLARLRCGTSRSFVAISAQLLAPQHPHRIAAVSSAVVHITSVFVYMCICSVWGTRHRWLALSHVVHLAPAQDSLTGR